MMALLDRDPTALRLGDALPPCWHWLYLHSSIKRSEVGVDGHPRRGGWLPPILLTRRLWAGSRLRFSAPLRLGQSAERRSEVRAIEEKKGRSGDLVFVRVRHTITGPSGLLVDEDQDLVFRDPPAEDAPRPGEPLPAESDWEERFEPDAPTLFRFSAITMNGHRVHYDFPYATGLEGYRGLLVHAPLTALLLLDAAGRRISAPVASFQFQARSPLFNGEPVTLLGRATNAAETAVWAGGPDGSIAVQGTVGWVR